jgi:hypothetical protein
MYFIKTNIRELTDKLQNWANLVEKFKIIENWIEINSYKNGNFHEKLSTKAQKFINTFNILSVSSL